MTRNEVIDAIVEALTDQEKAVKKATIRKHQKIGAGVGGAVGLGRALKPYAKGQVKTQRRGLYKTLRATDRMFNDMSGNSNAAGSDSSLGGKAGAKKMVQRMAMMQNATVPIIGGVHAGLGAIGGSITGRIHAAHKIRKMRKAAQ